MTGYSVFVDDHYIMTLPDEGDADFLRESLDILFLAEHLHYKVSMKREVM